MPFRPSPDGGGGTGSDPYLVVSPATPYNLGTGVVGTPLTGTIVVKSNRLTVAWSLTNSSGNFTVGPPTSGTAGVGGTNIPISINKAVGSYSTTVTITDLSTGIVHSIIVNAAFVAVGATLVATPASVLFPPNVLSSPVNQQVVQISNNTGGSITVTAIIVAGLTFKCLTAPFTIANGAHVNITLQTDYSLVGVLAGTVTLKSTLPDLVIPLSVVVSFVASVDVLQNLTRGILMGSDNLSQMFDGTNFNPLLDCVLVFNGSLWNNPGNEKVLRKVQVFYENVGVCSGLKLDISSWRPSLTPPAFDQATSTISIGDVSADGSERSAFFNVEIAGEILVMQITRLSNTGPISLIGFTPHFEDKGEVVQNT